MALFKKIKYTRFEDKIWLNKELKYQGILVEIEKALKKYSLIIVIYHFDKTIEDLKILFEKHRMVYKQFSTNWEISMTVLQELSNESIKVVMLSADMLPTDELMQSFPVESGSTQKEFYFLITEHYPFPDEDEKLLGILNKMPGMVSVCWHASLNEPLMELFVNENMIRMMKNLGWDEDRCISHPMLTKSIYNIQKKIRKEALGDQKVSSMEEWFKYNYPGMRTMS